MISKHVYWLNVSKHAFKFLKYIFFTGLESFLQKMNSVCVDKKFEKHEFANEVLVLLSDEI